MKPFTFQVGKRIRTADRVAVLIVIVSLLLLAVASYGAWHMKSQQDRSTAILSRSVDSLRAAAELELHIQELRHDLDLYFWRHHLDDLEQTDFTELRATKSERADINLWLERAEKAAHTSKETELIAQVRAGLAKFDVHLD